jgi:hypothetical protein
MIERLLILALGLFLLLPAQSKALNAKDFDDVEDGIISVEEMMRFARAKQSPPLSTFDRDGNGSLSDDEIANANEALGNLDQAIKSDVDIFIDDYPDGQPIAEFAKEYKTDDWEDLQPKRPWANFPLKIRESHEDVSHSDHVTPASKVNPAQISFTRDLQADNEILAIGGTLMWPLQLSSDKRLLGVPSVTINKVTNENDPAKETDSLTWRFGFDHEREGRAGLYYLRVNPTWTTDTDFDLDIRGLEAQFETSSVFPGSGRMVYTKNEVIGLRWRAMLHAEYGKVEDAAGNASLIEGESFTRIGIKTKGLLVLGGTDRVTLGLSWEYLARVSGDLRDRKLFASTLGYSIDEDGHFLLQTTYTNGDPSAALEDQELWTVGKRLTS